MKTALSFLSRYKEILLIVAAVVVLGLIVTTERGNRQHREILELPTNTPYQVTPSLASTDYEALRGIKHGDYFANVETYLKDWVDNPEILKSFPTIDNEAAFSQIEDAVIQIVLKNHYALTVNLITGMGGVNNRSINKPAHFQDLCNGLENQSKVDASWVSDKMTFTITQNYCFEKNVTTVWVVHSNTLEERKS